MQQEQYKVHLESFEGPLDLLLHLIKENKMDIDGFTQSDYLDAASVYFKNNEIFDRTTDAIYLVMTKSDLMPDVKDYHERVEYSKMHLKTNNFIALRPFKILL